MVDEMLRVEVWDECGILVRRGRYHVGSRDEPVQAMSHQHHNTNRVPNLNMQ
jgi:hypothetical protein